MSEFIFRTTIDPSRTELKDFGNTMCFMVDDLRVEVYFVATLKLYSSRPLFLYTL